MTTVLGIAGSPRRNGNTDILLDEVLRGAASRGAETRTVVLTSLKIAGCIHCDGCLKTGICVVQDDMPTLHADFRRVEHIVLATPVFFMGPTAQAKAMIDRCQALWVMKYVLKQPVALVPIEQRRALLVAVGGARYRDLFQPTIAIVRSWLRTLEMPYGGELLYADIDKAGAIRQHPTAFQEAFAAGQKLVDG